MRRSSYGEAYCHNANDVLAEMESKQEKRADVHVTNPRLPSREDGWRATMEVVRNDTGGCVLFIEADQIFGCLLIARVAKLDTTQVE